jgi:hypothetical protein
MERLGWLRVHQFAHIEGVKVRTVWFWVSIGKVESQRDSGGHRLWVRKKTPANSGKEWQTVANSALQRPEEA